jgi:enediyne biosynthesis protein E4
MGVSRRRLMRFAALVLSSALLWFAWTWWTARSNAQTFDEIKSEMARARYGIAAKRLTELLGKSSSADEATYLLGICEERRGHNEGAAKAWAKITPGTSFSHLALQARVQQAEESGRFAEVERLVTEAAQDRRNDGTELRAMLVPLYSQLGRIDEAERLVEARWERLNADGKRALERAIFQLRLHIVLTLKTNSVENIRQYLDQAARFAPNDDRVWLGRANLAIRTGDFDEAKRWLDACLERRPDDAPVWRARLNWGMGANRVDVVQQALPHLQAPDSTPAEVYELAAWLLRQRGDFRSERRELERLVAVDTGNRAAILRLAELAEKDGEIPQVAKLLRKAEEIDRLRDRYIKLYDRKQPVRDAIEMARLAEQLGRTFEARAFLTLAIAENPDRVDLRSELVRLKSRVSPVAMRRQTLAEALANELGSDAAHGSTLGDDDGQSR